MTERFDVLNNNEYDWKTVRSHSKHVHKNDTKRNFKQQLCKNMIETSTCCYGTKCLFAHKLEEQTMNQHRQCAYEIVMGNGDLSHIDMMKNPRIYRALFSLTTLCEQCKIGKCTGGYNCKHGACKQSYVVCQQDLDHGNCVVLNCKNVHLTKRKLKPFFGNNSITTKGILLTEEFFNKIKPETSNNPNDSDDSKNSSCNVSHEDSDVGDDCDRSIFE